MIYFTVSFPEIESFLKFRNMYRDETNITLHHTHKKETVMFVSVLFLKKKKMHLMLCLNNLIIIIKRC